MQTKRRRQRSRQAAPAARIGSWALVWLLAISVVVGCNMGLFGGNSSAPIPERFWAGVRTPAGETERLMRNARYLKTAGRTDMALKELEEAHQRDPGNLKIVDTLAQCYEELGEYPRAEELYQEALDRNPGNPALTNNLCFSYYLAGKFDKAETCFRQALKNHPHNVTLRNNLGLLLARTGRQEEAYHVWREVEGKEIANQRLYQALAALGIEPQPSLARQPQVPKANLEPLATPEKAVKTAPQAPIEPKAAPAPKQPAKLAQNLNQQGPQVTRPSPKPTRPENLATYLRRKVTTPAPAPAALSSHDQASAGTESETARPKPAPTKHVALTPVSPSPSGQGRVLNSQSPEPAPAASQIGVEVAAQEIPASVSPLTPQPPTPPPDKDSKNTAQLKRPQPAGTSQAPIPAARDLRQKAQSAPKPLPAVKPLKMKRTPFLTAQELFNTRIELRNGNGVQGFAGLNRTWLSMEGFTVAAIGNHIDFGLDQTVIYYHPDSERVAQVLNEQYFHQAQRQAMAKLGKTADVKIVLGHDQKPRQKHIARRVATLEFKARLAYLEAKILAGIKASSWAASAPKPTPARLSQKASEPGRLTKEELSAAKIELRNGNGVQDAARKQRSELSRQGFQVVRVGNHIDFGMQQTVIYYRPGTERVAQSLGEKFFRSARLEEVTKLPKNLDIKVILGHDLKGRPNLLAKAVR